MSTSASGELVPLNLRSENGALLIEWSDGNTYETSWAALRKGCPCATCRTKRDEPPAALPVLAPEEVEPVRLIGMKPLGNYAYNISFSDGHATGIYSLELLRELGSKTAD